MEVHKGRTEVPQTVRSRATHERITSSLVRLIESGQHNPGALEVAVSAEVSPRTIFHHFNDLDQMYSAALTAQVARAQAALVDIDAAGSLETRCSAIAINRDAIHAALAPTLRAFVASPNRASRLAMHDEHESLRKAMQHQTHATFGRELRLLPDPLAALLGVETALSFAVWDYLHRVQGVSREGTRQYMSALALSITRSFGA